MSVVILWGAAALYAVASAAYVVFFARPRYAALARVGVWLIALAFVAHSIALGAAYRTYGPQIFNLRGGFGLLAWCGAGAFLFLQRRGRIPEVGAFVVPLVLIALLPGLVGAGRQDRGILPSVVRWPALQLHVSTAIGSVALFAIACAVALMYLLQEREVKTKRFGALFVRLPSLDVLDQLNQRLVRTGFVFWSAALISGAVVAKRAWGSFWSWDLQQVASIGIWLLYGALVHLRRKGVRGHRYAQLTLTGFALILGTIAGSGMVPHMTRHGGHFQ